MTRLFAGGLRLAALLGACGLGACSAVGIEEPGSGSTLRNLLKYGSTTEPPLATAPVVEAAGCPNVQVSEGHSNIRSGANQVSIANLARECIERKDGSVIVKVGVEGRALLGPGGRSGRFDVPVTFAVRQGDKVLASRVKRVSVSIPADQAQASFVAVEGDMVVPPGTGEFDIVVGLGGSAPSAGAPARRRRPG